MFYYSQMKLLLLAVLQYIYSTTKKMYLSLSICWLNATKL